MRNIFLLSLALLLFSGCDLFKSEGEIKREMQLKKEQMQKAQEIEKLKIESKKSESLTKINSEKEMALLEKEKEIEMKKSLAIIEKDKALETKRLDVELRAKELEIKKAEAEAKLKHEQMINEQNNRLRLEKYGFAILALIVIIIAFFIFYYFKKRREDKLRAYNDNLEKYFRQKEDLARIKIAEKLLDTIATGKFSKEQENRLIAVFNPDGSEKFSENETLVEEDIEVLEIIESKDSKS